MKFLLLSNVNMQPLARLMKPHEVACGTYNSLLADLSARRDAGAVKLIAQLKADEAIAEADTLLLTVPNQLGVDYNAHVIEAILKHIAPRLGWR